MNETYDDDVHYRFEMAISSRRKSDNDLSLLRELLSQGAKINGREGWGLPLRHACMKRSVSLVNFLIEMGADVNATITKENIKNAFQIKDSTILHWASHVANKNINIGNRDSLRIILELMANGANPNAKDGKGNYPASNIEPNRPLIYFQTFSLPIHAALKLEEPTLCVKLMNRGYSADDKNNSKQTAWRYAELNSPQCYGAMQSWRARQSINEILKAEISASP